MIIRSANNKTEELMNDITERLIRSKRKYFVVCQNNRGIQYVDGSKDINFLKKVRDNINNLLSQIDEDKK